MLILFQIYTLFSNCHEIDSSHHYFRNINHIESGQWLANIKLLLLDTWLLGALDAFREMLAQVSELARIKYDVS